MLQLKNETPFEASIAVFPDQNGIDTLYVALKATFEIGQKMRLAETQIPIFMEDVFWGEPGQSSLKYASELHLSKPATDIVLVGDACAPDYRAVSEIETSLTVAGMRKTVRVFGDRQWDDGLFALSISSPASFERMPLVYERAFGGTHEDRETGRVGFETRNPVGLGFRGQRTKQEIKGMLLPNLEDPLTPIVKPNDAPQPACFGFTSPTWEPRKSHAGVYDEAWQQKRAPLLPDDFDNKFFNSAHPDLICDGYLTGGESVSLVNLSPHGPLTFQLPICAFNLDVSIAGQTERPELKMETVLLEPGEMRFSQLWRASVPCDKKTLKVEQVSIALDKIDFGGGLN